MNGLTTALANAQASSVGNLSDAQATAGPGAAGHLALRNVIEPSLAVFFIAFFTCIIVTPLMRHLAVRYGIIDWPDLKRKAHPQAVAYLGGVGIFIGWLAGVIGCYVIDPGRPFPIEVIVGAAVVTLTGFFDDVYGIRARVKVGGQLFAAAALASVTFTSGQGQAIGAQLIESSLHVIGVTHVAPWLIYVIGTMVIAVFVLGGCNAVNLIDGLDGLAAGVISIVGVGLLLIAALVAVRHAQASGAVAAMHLSDTVRIVMCLALLGSVLGFLPYNFRPATIFMGDAGSLLLGYLAVSTILMFADTGGDPNDQINTLKVVAAGLIVFALPITDTSLAIFRRKMQGRPLFAPDSRHMHHLLRRRGLTVRQTVMFLYSLSALFGVLGVGMIWLDLPLGYVAAVFVVLYGFIIVMAYKYGELNLLHQHARDTAEPQTLGHPRPPGTTPGSRSPAQAPGLNHETGPSPTRANHAKPKPTPSAHDRPTDEPSEPAEAPTET